MPNWLCRKLYNFQHPLPWPIFVFDRKDDKKDMAERYPRWRKSMENTVKSRRKNTPDIKAALAALQSCNISFREIQKNARHLFFSPLPFYFEWGPVEVFIQLARPLVS